MTYGDGRTVGSIPQAGRRNLGGVPQSALPDVGRPVHVHRKGFAVRANRPNGRPAVGSLFRGPQQRGRAQGGVVEGSREARAVEPERCGRGCLGARPLRRELSPPLNIFPPI